MCGVWRGASPLAVGQQNNNGAGLGRRQQVYFQTSHTPHRGKLHHGMAIFNRSPLAPTICGKLKGVVYQRSSWGLMGRARRYSVSYPSEAAQRRMAALADLARYWAYKLTDPQRLTWGVYSNTHPLSSPCTGIRFLAPISWFIKINMPRYLAGQALLFFAP